MDFIPSNSNNETSKSENLTHKTCRIRHIVQADIYWRRKPLFIDVFWYVFLFLYFHTITCNLHAPFTSNFSNLHSQFCSMLTWQRMPKVYRINCTQYQSINGQPMTQPKIRTILFKVKLQFGAVAIIVINLRCTQLHDECNTKLIDRDETKKRRKKKHYVAGGRFQWANHARVDLVVIVWQTCVRCLRFPRTLLWVLFNKLCIYIDIKRF